jgi:hypothetical protein
LGTSLLQRADICSLRHGLTESGAVASVCQLCDPLQQSLWPVIFFAASLGQGFNINTPGIKLSNQLDVDAKFFRKLIGHA